MTRRLLDRAASEISTMTRDELIAAIRASEGRTLVCEVASSTEPMLVSVSNAELAAAMSADIILVNLFDVQNPAIAGLPDGTAPEAALADVKRLTGLPVGINLEPVDEQLVDSLDEAYRVPAGRIATVENAQRAVELGVNLIVLTGNPGAGVSNATIAASLRQLREAVGSQVVLAAGRMHAAGVFDSRAAIDLDDVDAFADAGADILLVPTPGTVPGMTIDTAHRLLSRARERGVLTMTTIGTSQEGADEATMRQFALNAKMAGADIHHIGDAGYAGIAVPENVLAYSIAMRGRRHTFARMARSVRR